MMRRRNRGRWVALLVAAVAANAAVAAVAASPLLDCRVRPAHPLLGHQLHWDIRAVDLPAIALLQQARLGPDWLLQRQTGQRSVSGPRRSTQTLRLTLYPMAAGALQLPALRAGDRGCAARTVQVAVAPSGQTALLLSAHVDAAHATVGQALRVELDAGAGGALAWQAVRAVSDNGLLRPIGSVSTTVQVDGRQVRVQRQSWSVTPLRAGTATIRFGLLRATPFGQLRVYPVPALRFTVDALPAYWPADGAVGRARLRLDAAPVRLALGSRGTLHATLDGVQIGRGALLALLARVRARDGGALRLGAARVRLEPRSANAVTPVWRIALPFRVVAGGRVAYPRLRIPYYDPRRGAPGLAQAGWGEALATDPRPWRLLAAGALVGALVLTLAALRRAVRALRGWRCRARWRAIARRGDAPALVRAWRDAVARSDPDARTLRGWVRAQRCAGAAIGEPGLAPLVEAEEARRYAR